MSATVIFTARSKVRVFSPQCNTIITEQSVTNQTASRYIGSAEFGS